MTERNQDKRLPPFSSCCALLAMTRVKDRCCRTGACANSVPRKATAMMHLYVTMTRNHDP